MEFVQQGLYTPLVLFNISAALFLIGRRSDSTKGLFMQNDEVGPQRNPVAASDPVGASPRLLLIAPASPPLHLRGGMDIAAANVADELRQRGWVVDMPLVLAAEPSSGDAAASTHTALHKPSAMRPLPLLKLLLRSPAVIDRLPRFLQGHSSLFVDRTRYTSSTIICWRWSGC